MKDYRIDPYTRDYTVSGGRYALSDDIRNNIYLSLTVQKGTWPFSPGFGSLLHLLSREKSLERMEATAKEYCDSALKWIIDRGRAESVTVTPALDRDNLRMTCLIEAAQKGKLITYEHFVEVR